VNFRSRGRGRGSEDMGIDLTPMIDVVFQLVLFLAVQAKFDEAEAEKKLADEAPGIQVDLPRSSAQAVIADKQDINVWMSSDGQVFLDDVPADNSALKGAFKDAAKKNPGTLVIIKADKGVAHGRVVGVMDLARNAGLSRLAIATSNGEGGGSM
jgi:biopolymer transport protein ExbD